LNSLLAASKGVVGGQQARLTDIEIEIKASGSRAQSIHRDSRRAALPTGQKSIRVDVLASFPVAWLSSRFAAHTRHLNIAFPTSCVVLSVQKVLSGFGRVGRLRLMGKYTDHRLVARPEPDNTFWTDYLCLPGHAERRTRHQA